MIQAQGVVALEARCAGVKKTYPTSRTSRSTAPTCRLSSRRSTRSCRRTRRSTTSSPSARIALAARQAIRSANSTAKVVTFDLNKDAAQAIKDGKIIFAVDQQPYVQGYLSVQMLYLNITNGNDLGGGKPVLTGPSFVDSTNIDKILRSRRTTPASRGSGSRLSDPAPRPRSPLEPS